MTHQHNFQLHLYAVSRQGHTKLLAENLSFCLPHKARMPLICKSLKSMTNVHWNFQRVPPESICKSLIHAALPHTQWYCTDQTYSLMSDTYLLSWDCYEPEYGERLTIMKRQFGVYLSFLSPFLFASKSIMRHVFHMFNVTEADQCGLADSILRYQWLNRKKFGNCEMIWAAQRMLDWNPKQRSLVPQH